MIEPPWQDRLKFVIETVRVLSALTDPQEMVLNYTKRVRLLMPVDATVSLSRRGYAAPDVRVTRASIWGSNVNPWKQTSDLVSFPRPTWSTRIFRIRPRTGR